MDKVTMDKMTAITDLRLHDHAIMSVGHATKLAAPFGVQPPVRVFQEGVDRVARIEGDGKGVDAAELAETIGRSMGLDWEPAMGVGTRLRRACDAVIAALPA
jgi:hypothetical protein